MTTRYAHGTFNYVDLAAKDRETAGTFYETLFGWSFCERDTHGGAPYGVFFKDERVAAGIGQLSTEMIEQGVPSRWNTYVAVDDIAAAEARVKKLGGSLMMQTMDALDAGRTNFVTDPEGAVFALWEANGHVGSEIVNEPGSFCWNERATRDLDGVKRFYGELFGWTFKDEPHPATTMSMISNAEGREIGHALVMTAEWRGMPAHWSVYFAVDSCDGTVDLAKSLGGAVPVPPMDIPVGRFAVVADPGGAHFYVIQLRPS